MAKSSSKRKIPTRIAELRQASGLTQIELAGQIGVTETTIANWENGRAEWIERFALLCDALDCSIHDLLKTPLKTLREDAKHTQLSLARAVDVRENTVATWENKDTLRERIENVAKLCIALDCPSPEDLLQPQKKHKGASQLGSLSGEELLRRLEEKLPNPSSPGHLEGKRATH